MTEFNDTERMSSVKQEAVRAAVNIKEELTKLIADSYDQGVKDALEVARNAAIEEVAQHIEKMRVFGNDTISSFAIYIREMKKCPEHEQSILNLELSARATNVLRAENIQTIGQLIGRLKDCDYYLSKLCNCGKVTEHEIKNALKERGLSWGQT